MDPSKDLAAYGYGSVAWKERMEIWKQRQEKLQVSRNENGGKDWDNDGDGPDLPLYDPVTSLVSQRTHVTMLLPMVTFVVVANNLACN